MHRYKDKKNNLMVKSKTNFFTVATFVLMAGTLGSAIIAPLALQPASAQAFIDSESNLAVEPKAPIEVSPNGRNAYIVWWTNSSGNWEVMFRASTDGGQTFGDKINLSNSTDAESQNAEIAAAGRIVYVSWWETNPETGSSESVLRVSRDSGQTFGPLIMLGTDGTVNTRTVNTTTEDNATSAGGAHAQHFQ